MDKNLQLIASLLDGTLVRHAPDRAEEIREKVMDLLSYVDAYGVTVN